MLLMQENMEKKNQLIDIEDLDSLWLDKNSDKIPCRHHVKATPFAIQIIKSETDKELSIVDELSKQFAQLQITLKNQSKEIDALKTKQIKLEKDRDNLKARLLVTGVSDGMIAQFQRLISSLNSTALVKLAADSEVKALLQKIDLTEAQAKNDTLVRELITIVREKEQNLHNKKSIVMSTISQTTLILTTVALKFYAPALASMAVESVFENGFDSYIPENIQNLYQPANGGFFDFAVVSPVKHHAMNFAFNTVSEHDAYTLAASYAISNILNKSTGWIYSGVRTAINTAYLHMYQGKENNNLYSLLFAMQSIQEKEIPQVVVANKLDGHPAMQINDVVENQGTLCVKGKQESEKSVVAVLK